MRSLSRRLSANLDRRDADDQSDQALHAQPGIGNRTAIQEGFSSIERIKGAKFDTGLNSSLVLIVSII